MLDGLFERYKTSLYLVNQGSGIGLSLCKTLTESLGGRIWLDTTYNSGITGCPGARFVVSLDAAIVQPKGSPRPTASCPRAIKEEEAHQAESVSSQTKEETDSEMALPVSFSVLFVDDSMVLRKLFARVLSKTLPLWKISCTDSGESALEMVENEQFDLIFMDQVRQVPRILVSLSFSVHGYHGEPNAGNRSSRCHEDQECVRNNLWTLCKQFRGRFSSCWRDLSPKAVSNRSGRG